MKKIINISTVVVAIVLSFGTMNAQTNLAQEAKSSLVAGNYTKAIEQYDQLIQSADKYAPSYYARGVAKYKMKNIDGAIADFEKAAALDSTYYLAFHGLSLCYFQKADYRKVINYYQIVKELNKSFAPNYYIKGLALYNTDNIQSANTAFAQVLTFDNKYYKAFYGQALCMKAMNLFDMSIGTLKRYIELAGNQDGLQAECERLIAEMQKELNK